MFMIFVSFFPLGPIIRLVLLLYETYYDYNHNNNNNDSSSASLINNHGIANNGGGADDTTTSATITQILQQLALPNGVLPMTRGMAGGITFTYSSTSSQSQQHHSLHDDSKTLLAYDLQLLIPWLFSILMMFLVPCIIQLHARREFNRNHNRRHEPFLFRFGREKRIKILISCLKHYSKMLTMEDLKEVINADVTPFEADAPLNQDKNEESKNHINDDSESFSSTETNYKENMQDTKNTTSAENEQLFMIPKPGISMKQITTCSINCTDANRDCQKRLVSDVCAICFSSYEVNETISWSSNEKCQHVFHKECISTWILKRNTSDCPCCRLHFIDSKVYHGRIAFY